MNAVRLTVPDLGSGKLLAIEYFSKGKTIDSYWYEGEGVEATLIPKATTRTLRSCVCPVKPV